jgi:elongation of very long chain fatty acids protein 4
MGRKSDVKKKQDEPSSLQRGRSKEEMDADTSAGYDSWPIPHVDSAPAMFEHLTEDKIVDLRRRSLTGINVIVERSANGPLLAHPMALAVVIAAVYLAYFLPNVMFIGWAQWQAAVDKGSIEVRPGGIASEVSWAVALVVTFAYCTMALSTVRFMEKRAPVQIGIFEFMAIYNVMQVLLNLYMVVAIVLEVYRLGFRAWGYEPDASPEGYRLGQLIYLQYHCRQLELMDTFFVIFRKKFESVSFLHMYMRVLNMWGWFFACRYACGGDTYFPALVSAASQFIQYSYFCLSLFGFRSVPFFRKAIVSEVQIAQFVVCILFNLYVAYIGHLPRMLAIVQLFVVGNGLVLFTDFHYRETHPAPAGGFTRQVSPPSKGEKLIFSFDSAGWLYVYHFGVAHWLQEHLTPGITPENVNDGDYPEGLGFSGSSAGALTALLLASATPVRNVLEHVLAQHKACSRNPRMMPICVEEALRKYKFDEAPRALTGRLRILVTRALPKPPFIMAEVVDKYPDNETAIQWLLASCHVPLFFGILPYRFNGGMFYDGGLWSSFLVPWRARQGDRIVKVSGIGSPTSHIKPPFIPPWWTMFPPNERVLRGLFWRGYQDAARWFQSEPQTMLDGCGLCSCRTRSSRMEGLGDAVLERNDSDGTHEAETWKAAQLLLRRKPAPQEEELPKVDEATGEEVSVLLEDFLKASSNRLWGASYLTMYSLAFLTIASLPLRNMVLAVAILVSVSATWTLT